MYRDAAENVRGNSRPPAQQAIYEKLMEAGRPVQGALSDHAVQDPLALHKEIRARRHRMQEVATDSAQPRIGYACMWEEIPERSWSYTAWYLRAELRLVTDTIDIGVQIPRLQRTILRVINARIRAGRLTTTWNYSRLTDAYIEHALRRELSRNPEARRCDAVLMAYNQGDLAALPIPYFPFTDMTWDAFATMSGGVDASAAHLSMTPSAIERRRERQLVIYERATGVIAESRWLASSLIEETGLPSGKVHVVHPGISAGWESTRQGKHQLRPPLQERTAPRRRLLYVGARDFYRKGGDLVVAALDILRREHDPQITLTVVGPQTWPLPGSLPDGIQFLGALPPHKVTSLYESHDLFVMPSRYEPFGKVFAEALARGLPCVARDAFAMPEIITPGVSGALITRDDENELAATIAAVLADDALYESCYRRAPAMAEYFSWERAALQVTDVIAQALRPAT
jgi:glycosyltransferase involved in cell wall biosynthesis